MFQSNKSQKKGLRKTSDINEKHKLLGQLSEFEKFVLEACKEYFEKHAPSCKYRRSSAEGPFCKITGGPCEKPWKCPKLRKGGR